MYELTPCQDVNQSGEIDFAEVSEACSWQSVVTLSLNRVLYQFTGLWRYIEVSIFKRLLTSRCGRVNC
jgi:hypothetical protein